MKKQSPAVAKLSEKIQKAVVELKDLREKLKSLKVEARTIMAAEKVAKKTAKKPAKRVVKKVAKKAVAKKAAPSRRTKK